MGLAPIFVIGFQRSGTTLLQSMLGAHRSIAAPPEMHFVFRISNLAHYYGDLQDDGNLRRALHDTLNPPIPTLDELDVDEDRVFEAARKGPRTYAALLDAVMSDIATGLGKQRWSEKSPGQRPDAVLGLFPDAQLVHIIRDPMDVVASSVEMPWMAESARQVARSWRALTMSALQVGLSAGPSQYLMVRYEDLVRAPEVVLRRVCAFMGEDFDARMLDPKARASAGTISSHARAWQAGPLQEVAPQPVRAGSLGRWQRASVAAVVYRERAALGYGPTASRAVTAGAVYNTARSVEDLPGLVRRAWLRRRFTPARHYVEVQRWLTERSRHVPTER